MKKLLFVPLMVSASFFFASADSYDGPFCFESASISNKLSEDEQSRDDGNIRGTCKKIEFARIISLDSSITNYHFVTRQIENPYSGETSGSVATTSRSIQDDSWFNLYLKRTLPYEDEDDSDLIPVWFMASEEPYNVFDSEEALKNSTSSLFLNHYNRATLYPYSRGNGKFSKATYVPTTSPITKVIENWRITKMPNGFMLIKDRAEIHLDNGTVKVLAKPEPVATSTETTVEQKTGFFSSFLSFFRNLF